MVKNITGKILIRNDSEANWIAKNPILSKGELVFDNTNRKIKVGDGINQYLNLPTVNMDLFNGQNSSYYLNYNNLTNKPNIPTVGSISYTTTTNNTPSSESLSGVISLHKISKSGNYNDLLNRPTIPTTLPNPNKLSICGIDYDGSSLVNISKVESSKSADKVVNALTFTGGATGTYDGSTAKTIEIPTSLTNTASLILKLNSGTTEGTNMFTYNGGTAKTINITPASIGAASTSHTHTKSQISDFPTSLKNPSSYIIKLNGGTTEGTNLFTYDGSVAKTINITPANIGAANSSHTHTKSQITDFPTSLKNPTALTFTGAVTGTYDGSTAKTVAIPTVPSSLKNPTSVIIKLNGGTTEGTNMFTYDGSSAKTVNITPASIGAAASSHTHSYLPLSGGTMVGDVILGNSPQISKLKVYTRSYSGDSSGAYDVVNGTSGGIIIGNTSTYLNLIGYDQLSYFDGRESIETFIGVDKKINELTNNSSGTFNISYKDYYTKIENNGTSITINITPENRYRSILSEFLIEIHTDTVYTLVINYTDPINNQTKLVKWNVDPSYVIIPNSTQQISIVNGFGVICTFDD